MPDDALTALAHDQMPFTAALGLRIERGSADEVVASADWAADRCTVGGALHGGYLMALADSVARADGKPVTRTTQTQAVIQPG